MNIAKMKPYAMHDNWAAPLGPEELLPALKRVIDLKGGRIDRYGANSLHVSFGSRKSFRFWGLALHPSPESAAPVVLDITWNEDQSTPIQIQVEARSDEGWSVYRGKRLANFYQKVLRDTINALKSGTR